MKQVLIIDDDPKVRKVVNAILSRQGFVTHETPNGKSALALLENCSVDLVITDIFMPEMDGLETLKEIKSHSPGVKTIAISGGGRYLDADLYLHMAKFMGADVVLSKPVSSETLLRTINDLFEAEIVACPTMRS